MKSPLRYQVTEYDCGPTTMTNAIMYLFERDEIPPDLVRHIGQCTLDSFDETGHVGRFGTSGASIRYFGSWLNELRYAGLLPIESWYLEKDSVILGEGSELDNALEKGAAIVLHVFFNGYGHYILITGKDGEKYKVFDPYYSEKYLETSDISIIKDQPYSHNLLISKDLINKVTGEDYSMGTVNTREALVMRRYNMDSLYII